MREEFQGDDAGGDEALLVRLVVAIHEMCLIYSLPNCAERLYHTCTLARAAPWTSVFPARRRRRANAGGLAAPGPDLPHAERMGEIHP